MSKGSWLDETVIGRVIASCPHPAPQTISPLINGRRWVLWDYCERCGSAPLWERGA